MTTSAHQRIFLWQRQGEAAGLTSIIGGVRSDRVGELLVRTRGAPERVRSLIGKALRFTGRLLVLSPALILPKLLIPGRTASDLMTVGFVMVVVAFFASLNLYFLASFVWWARRKSGISVRFPEARDVIDETKAAAAEQAVSGTIIRARGVVVPLAPCTAVLRRLEVDAPVLARLVEMTAFAVIPERGLPVVVTSAKMPFVEAPATREPADLPDSATDLLPVGAVFREWSTIVPGDTVEVIATIDRVVDNSDHFDLAGEEASLPRAPAGEEDPYRRGPAGPAIVVGAAGTEVVVRKVL